MGRKKRNESFKHQFPRQQIKIKLHYYNLFSEQWENKVWKIEAFKNISLYIYKHSVFSNQWTAGWDYGWDRFSSHLNFAEGENHFLETLEMKRSLHPCSQGAGEGESPPQSPPSCHRLTTSSSLCILSLSLQYISIASGHASPLWAPTRLAHTRTRTCTPVTRTPPQHGGAPRASSTIHIFPCSGFSFNMQVFPRGRGRRGRYNGGDRMRRKQYGKNKYFQSVNLTFFSSLKFH